MGGIVMCSLKHNGYRIAICDDEEKILIEMKEKLQRVLLQQNVVASCYLFDQPLELLSYVEENEIDILFLDIDMPGMSGMEVAKVLREKGQAPLIVFVTNQDALVYESFQYQPFSFIRKSYFDNEITQVVIGLIASIEKSFETFTLKYGMERIRLLIADIIYFEADSNYVKLVTTKKEYRYRETLLVLEKDLACKGFIRIHKGFLVNQSYVFAVRANEVELSNGCLLPISRTNREAVRGCLMKYMRC